MPFRNAFDDGQSQAAPFCISGPMPLNAIEFFKEVHLVFLVNARTAIADTDPDFVPFEPDGQCHIPAVWRVLEPIHQ